MDVGRANVVVMETKWYQYLRGQPDHGLAADVLDFESFWQQLDLEQRNGWELTTAS